MLLVKLVIMMFDALFFKRSATQDRNYHQLNMMALMLPYEYHNYILAAQTVCRKMKCRYHVL